MTTNDDYAKTLALFAKAHDETYPPPGRPRLKAPVVERAEEPAFSAMPPAPRSLKTALGMGALCAVFLVGACARTFVG